MGVRRSPALGAKYRYLSEEMSGISLQDKIRNIGGDEMYVDISKEPQFEKLSRVKRPDARADWCRSESGAAAPEPSVFVPEEREPLNAPLSPEEQHPVSENEHSVDKDESVMQTLDNDISSEQLPTNDTPDEQLTVNDTTGEQTADVLMSDVQTIDKAHEEVQAPDVPSELEPDVPMADTSKETDVAMSRPDTPLDDQISDSSLSTLDSPIPPDGGTWPTTPTSAEVAISFNPDDPLDNICMQLPDPETICSPNFDHSYLKSNTFEPAHTLVSARKEKSHVQAIFEYRSGSFPISEDPSLWLYFQRQKYERWTALNPTCKHVRVQLVPQLSGCQNVNHLGQPQCRQCIKRAAGVACGFASVRYITLLTIELVDGTVAKRYLVCPIFRSEIEKAPAMRQPITPIVLPGRYVVENDNSSWLEFHILCMTSSSIKSLLRRELAIVRDVQVSEARGFSRGTISFYDSAKAPQAVVNQNDNVVHPIYACSPSPCILRKARVDKYRNCYRCRAPIFSAHFACCVCMEMICVNCFVDWDDADITEHFYIKEKGAAKGKSGAGRTDNSGIDSLSEISHCKHFLQTEADKPVFYSTRHRKSQFIRVSHFTEEELEMMLCKTNKIVQYCDLLDETQPSGYSAISLCSNVLRLDDPEKTVDYSWTSSRLDKIDMDTELIAKLGDADFGGDLSLRPSSLDLLCPCARASVAGPSSSQSRLLETEWDEKVSGIQLAQKQQLDDDYYPWQTTPIYVTAGQLTLREFARLWEESRVIVVRGLLDGLDGAICSPEFLIQTLGMLLVPVCKASTRQSMGESWTLEQFLSLFNKAVSEIQPLDSAGKYAERRKKIETTSLRASVRVKNVVDALEQRIRDSVAASEAEAALLTSPKKRRVSTAAKKKSTATSKSAAAAATTATSNNNLTGHSDSSDIKKYDPELVRHLKTLEEAFESILPFKEYTLPTGQLNLINRLPDQYKKPSIGPEIHCEYGRVQSGSQENMRCEGFDIVNVLLSTSSPDDMLPSTSQKSSDAADAHRPRARGRPRQAKASLETKKEEKQQRAV
ncbi:hypothetical protein EV175_000536, partial [Coemansia sp. RSA 1933]